MRILVRQFTSPIMLLLIGATILSLLLGERADGIIILMIVIASGFLGFLQEHRADRTMSELAAMVTVHADVRRGDAVVEVPVADVVVGDVIVLRAGDLIPADLELTSTMGLQIDESAVTGESLPVEKGKAVVADESSLPSDWAFFGTHVVSGEGEGVVRSVGKETRFGGLIEALAHQDVTTSFERSMRRFGFLLTQVMAILVVVVLVVQTWADRPLLESLMFALALAVGITPQMLPAIVMVSLSAGARRMAAQDVLVRRLDVIEDLGAMTVLCTDKTGTLTDGRLRLMQALDAQGTESDRVMHLAAINAGLQTAYVNPIDAAIKQRQGYSGIALDELPYDFSRRRMSVLADTESGRLLITKGAVESLLGCCAGQVDKDAIRDQVAALERQGLRVIALGSRPFEGESLQGEDERDLAFEGLLTFLDPPTPEATEALRSLHELGLLVCVISGDSRHVTQAVSQAVGLDHARVVLGSEVEALSDEDLAQLAREARIFAEVQPLQKARIITAFQANGHTVGFLGDGINDVAALRRADVGISVDGASDVAKQSADIVVMTKSLAGISEATVMGRRAFANTLKYIRVTISANFGNVVSMVVASLFLPFLPMLPVQILLLNLLSDAPALTLAGDRVDSDDLSQPQRWSLTEVRRFMVTFGLASSVIDISAFLLLHGWLDVTPQVFHSAWFLLSLCTEILALLALRSSAPMWRTHPSRGLLLTSLLAFLAGMGVLALDLTGTVGLVPLGLASAGVVAGLAVAYLAVNELMKLGQRARTS